MSKFKNAVSICCQIGDKKKGLGWKTVDQFLNTTFPIESMKEPSPNDNTKVLSVKINRKPLKLDTKSSLTMKGLKDYLSTPKNNQGYYRKGTYPIEEVKEVIKDVLFEVDKRNALVELDGDIIRGNSDRYRTFFTKGTKCVCCGIEGKYFAKEKDSLLKNRYHLNLYALDSEGKEILMTKDHIIPKSKGGKNHISNYQTMCINCNKQKADK